MAKIAIWQVCCTDLATMLISHFSKCFHWISCPQIHGFSRENHVAMSCRTETTNKMANKMAKWKEIWQHCFIHMATLFLTASIEFIILKNMGLAK